VLKSPQKSRKSQNYISSTQLTEHDRLLRTFKAGAHDIVEETREAWDFAGVTMSQSDDARLRARIIDMWGDPADAASIKRGLDYSTDAPGLKGAFRLRAQCEKSFDAYGDCIIHPDEQVSRMQDKLRQLYEDIDCASKGLMTVASMTRAAGKALEKSWICGLPEAQQDKNAFVKEYASAIDDLRRYAHSPAPA
jgi:hypothetical protein